MGTVCQVPQGHESEELSRLYGVQTSGAGAQSPGGYGLGSQVFSQSSYTVF